MADGKPNPSPPAVRATTEPINSTRVPASFETSDEAGSAFGNAVIRLLATKPRKLLPLSPLRARLTAIKEDAKATVPDVLALVEADPCAAIEIVSAAHFSRDAENICLQQAIEALGTVESLTLLREYATSSGDTWLGLNSHKLRRFWASTLFGAASARELAQWANHPNPESVFLVSLLHNTGEPLALSLLEGELHRQWSILSPNMASLVAYQHERLGRVYLGSRNIPSTICDIAGDHHNPIQSMLQALVFLGDTAALQYGYGYLRRTVDKHLLNAALKILNEPKLKLNELAAAIAPFLNKSLTVAR